MPVGRPPRDNELDRDELNALRGISKGLLIQTITPAQTERLKKLGFVREIAGVVTLTGAGKAFLGK